MVLTGCRTAPPRTVPGPGADAPWAEQLAELAKLDSYALNGRVAVAANGEGFSASLRYRQEKRRADLALDGPLGIGGMRMRLADAEIRVTNSRGQELDGVAAREEIERRLGFELPLAELRWWLLGLPAPGAPVDVHSDQGSGAPLDFQQNGWRVSINSRVPGLGFSLPQRLTFERGGAESVGAPGNIEGERARLKLFVERWQP
ncbi:MAG: outer membrane lipoprotein LolB [Myxococcales bacterium]|nr:outer membrane lipoprotein LolB [Myxococcales bacterium]